MARTITIEKIVSANVVNNLYAHNLLKSSNKITLCHPDFIFKI